ncbi:hypothetical protein GSI_08202 [Ganoderma sinense ZZ0214-1]|uniref:Uncharacterized protein n=1 Tax=Ganoderma sinense ZZ0214-1 TaxID=1077348 RepID=A0A2G8S719_9APHY|nr:hypothetical protein GSI_08202 [Ganoderma sinense ZZ0214-1]
MFALVREKLKGEGVSRSGDGADGVEKQTGIRVDDHDDDEDAEEDEDEGGEETTMLSNPEDNPGEDKSPWSAILTREKVVDFGRAWKARGGVYPANINPNIRWPRPARELRCQPITMAHDRFMLEEMHRLVASACEEADGPKKDEPNADDEDEGEDDREAMMSLG